MSMQSYTYDIYGLYGISDKLTVANYEGIIGEQSEWHDYADQTFGALCQQCIIDPCDLADIFYPLTCAIENTYGVRMDYLTVDEDGYDGLGISKGFPWEFNSQELGMNREGLDRIFKELFGVVPESDYFTLHYYG